MSESKRFRNRKLQLIDLLHRFEAAPASTHARDAIGVIERLDQDGSRLFRDDPQCLERWKSGCKELWKFIKMELSERRFLENQDLGTALREFFSEFEHTMHKLYQILHNTTTDPETDFNLQAFYSWREIAFRSATYAIVSYWIDEKHEKASMQINIQLKSSIPLVFTTQEIHSHKPMPKPKKKKHRRGMKRLN
ncbi:MAG: hypothetical protein OXO49_00895 [Gammaproteobacteria bacterium]|nr:hypothetical protein [Gammaproteobacteria bacterium]MDE0252936.1 hypothetical protein [Gammaproteobacteria bacterium]MDE0402051.1 hypothetical protein [Gammaproteobacteria bacterium]